METLQDWEVNNAEPASGALGELAGALGVSQEVLAAELVDARHARAGRSAVAVPREKPGRQ